MKRRPWFDRFPLVAPLALVLLAWGGRLAPLWAQEPAEASETRESDAQPAPETNAPTLTEEQRRQNLESFDTVWETVRDHHFDPDLNGVDWPAVRDELRPQVAEAETMDKARAVMREMLDRLGQSHFGIFPKSIYDAVEAAERGSGDGATGLHIRVVDGEALVVRVEPDSPAEAQGIRPGWVVETIEGEPVEPLLEKLEEAFGDSTLFALKASRAVENRLDGKIGAERVATFQNGEDASVETTMRLERKAGEPVRFGNLPKMALTFRAETIDGDIPVIAWNAFFDPSNIMPKIGSAVAENRDAPGMILDLRGNPGGIGAMAMGISGWFVDQTGTKLGTMRTRETSLKFVVFARPEPFDGPLAVLVDGCSASTTEILAAGLQDLDRAVIVGTRTAGAALPSVVLKLPNGDGFQYAFGNYISAGGEPLEGRGVIPDIEAPPERPALLDGRDPALEAAAAWIRAQHQTGD